MGETQAQTSRKNAPVYWQKKVPPVCMYASNWTKFELAAPLKI